jgi:DedD protein
MNDTYERSYYEIALTSTQAAVGIVLLLVCVVASFFAGMWVARQPADAVALTADATDATTADGETATEGEAAGAAADRPRASPARPAGESAAERSGPGGAAAGQRARKPAGGGDEDAETAAGGSNRGTPPRRRSTEASSTTATAGAEPQLRATGGAGSPTAAERAAGASQSTTNADASAPSSAGTDPVAPTTAQTTSPPEPARAQVERRERGAPPAPAPGLPVIQVLASSDQAQADALIKRLRTGGHPAFLSLGEESDRARFRVRVGPYADRAVAEERAQELKRTYRLDTWITTTP